MSRELHVLFPDENEYLVKVPTLTLPASVLFHAVYVCDITDCPSFKILKDKRANAKPGIPLPFIAAAETDIETLQASIFFAKPTGTMQFLKPHSGDKFKHELNDNLRLLTMCENSYNSYNKFFIKDTKELSCVLCDELNLHKPNTSAKSVL